MAHLNSLGLLLVRTLFLFIAFLVATTFSAATDNCFEADAQTAGNATDSMKSWTSIYSGFKRFWNCDDGGIAEGFTEAVVHLLASKWSSLPTVSVLIKKDPKFYKFFLRHIDASADTDELKKIYSLAQSECPINLQKLCLAIQSKTQQAIGES